MALTNRQRAVLRSSKRAIRKTTTPKEASDWRKAMRSSMRSSRGTLTSKERGLIQSAGKALKKTTTKKEARGAKAVLRRAAKK